MALERCKSLRDENVYVELIKTCQLDDPRQCSGHWLSLDVDEVADHYEKLLVALAETGCKVHVGIFTKCLHDSFPSSMSVCKSFAQKIADVGAHCRRKSLPSRRKNDVKTSKAVVAIMDAMAAARSPSVDGILSSSEEVVEEAPATPPPKGSADSDSSQALRKLLEAWGEGPPETSTACSSTGHYVPDSPISVASSSAHVVASPVPVPSSSAHVPDKPVQVQGLLFWKLPRINACGEMASVPFP